MPTKKTIRKTFLILIPMLIILSIYCFRNEIKRHYYEKYLQKEYSDLNLTIETKKKSKLEQDKPELAGIED